jgi:hypothetical protein
MSGRRRYLQDRDVALKTNRTFPVRVFVDVRALVRFLAIRRTQREARRVAPAAAGLLTASTWMLPVADWARHIEEYHSELWDLAQVGAGRAGQLGYALRQLCYAPRTGRALRSPRRRGAEPS